MKLFGGKRAEHTPAPKTEPAAAPETDKETAAQESGAEQFVSMVEKTRFY